MCSVRWLNNPNKFRYFWWLHALEDLISTWPLGDVLWQVVLSFMSLFQWLIKAWWPYQYLFCQIKILCLKIFLVTSLICGWKCLVDKDRYWETENSCYRNPVLLQRSYGKISYYGQQNKYSWDQLNRLGKSVIEGTIKRIYSKKHRKNCESCPGHSLTVSQLSKSLSL